MSRAFLGYIFRDILARRFA